MTLLVSGGHCLLAVVKKINEFILLGQTIDDAPGEALDKVQTVALYVHKYYFVFSVMFSQIARRLQLRNLKEFRNCCGGEAIEKAALKGDPRAIDLGTYMTSYKDCNFSYSGLKNTVRTEILKSEKKHGKTR